jgi:hypothetical protein
VHLVPGRDEVVDGGDAVGDPVGADVDELLSASGISEKRMRVRPCGS